MDRCEAPNCKMRTYAPTVEQVELFKNNYVISFHRFPDDPVRRQSWIDAAKKPSWKPPMFHSSLCSLHFCDNCFDENNDLHDHAVPSIFFDDFKSHMRESVKKLGMECKLDDDEIWKPSQSSASTQNCNIKSNKRSTIPTTDPVNANVLHYEEVLVCDESPEKLDVEHISIPVLNETMPISTGNNSKNPRVHLPALDVSKIILNNDCSIEKRISGSKSKSNHDDDAVSTKQIKIQKDSDKLQANSPPNVPRSNHSTKSTITPSTSVTSKPTTTSSTSAASNSSALVRGNSSSSGYSVMEPTTKDLVLQLLNIVKMANASTDEKKLKSGPTLNSYLVTSKCDDTDASDLCEILPSASVILNVASYVKEIKEESFVKPDNVNIICGSPAIFLLKNITVQECDPNMNCVYVITSENLLPHLYKMKLKSGVSTKSTPQQSTTASNAAGMIVQKPLQVADLVSSANPKSILPIQNQLRGSSDTTKPNTVPKRVSNSSNSVSCADPKPRPLDSISNSDSVKISENNSVLRSSLTTPSTSNLDAFVSTAKLPTIISYKVSHSSATQPPANDSVSGTPSVKVPRMELRSSNSTTPPTNVSTSGKPSVTPPVNTSICYNYLTKGAANISISTPAKPTTTASVSHSVTITPVKPANSSFKSPSSVTPAKPSVNTSISGPKGTFVKPSTKPSIPQNFTIITNSAVKPAFSTNPILTTIPTTPDTAIARVIQSPLQSATSVRSNGSQPTPIRNGIQSSSALSAIRSQPPTLNGAIATKSYSQSRSKSQPNAAPPTALKFRPIQLISFDTTLKPSEVLVTYDSLTSTSTPKRSTSLPHATKQTIPTILVRNQSTVIPSLKRKCDETDDSEDDDDDDDNDPFFANCNDEEYDREYFQQQRKQISKGEANILQKEREINSLKKKIQSLKKRLNSVKDPSDTKTDEQLVEEILSKYIDSNGIQFFIGQMKISGKTCTQFRWSEDDKLFALGLLYKNPVEYNVLCQKYTLPSDKTLHKFVNKVKKAEMEVKGTISRK